MNTNFANKIATGVIAGALAITLAGCNADAEEAGSPDAPVTSAPTVEAPVVEASEAPEVEVEEMTIDDLEVPDPETENRWNIAVEDINVHPTVDEAFGDGAGQRAARDGLIGLSELIAQNPALWTAHTEADEQLALASWVEFLTPEAYAEIQEDFWGSMFVIGADRDGALVTLDGTTYSVPANEMATWTPLTGVNVVVHDAEEGVVGFAFDARVDVPTNPAPVSAVYKFYVLVEPGDGDGWVISDVQYEVPRGVVVGE